jgi:putative transport protein
MIDQLGSLFDSFIELLDTSSVLMLFLILGFGYLIGGIRLGAFSLGPVAGVLFAGLFFGHFGLRLAPATQSLGFALFIFSVGYQAGPRFFSAIKEDGIKYLLLTLVVASSALLIAIVAAKLLNLEPGFSAGLLAGGLTSSPTLAAAQDAVREGNVVLKTSLSSDEIIGNVATAYAITYIFGLTGLITMLKFMPRLMGMDLVADCKRLEKAQNPGLKPVNVTMRCYRVNNEKMVRYNLRELRTKYCERIPVLKVVRDGAPIELKPTEHLQLGDVIELIAPRAFFTQGVAAIGEEIPLGRPIDKETDTAQIVVTNKDIFGHTLGELDIPSSFGILVMHVTKAGMRLPHSYDLALNKGDVITVVGPTQRVDAFGEYIGDVEHNISETDMVPFAFGIAVGVAIGLLSISVSGIALSLGNAGGLLCSGLAIGYMHSVRPTFGRLPEGASWLLMEFGLLLFMTGIGLRAGGDFLQTLQESGISLILAGITITIVPLVIAYLFGSKVLKLSPGILMGALTGAMTSGASLRVVTSEAQSSIPTIGYAGTYAFGNVLLMIAGPIILLF